MKNLLRTLLIVVLICSISLTIFACEKVDAPTQNPSKPGSTPEEDSKTIGKGTILFNSIQTMLEQSDVTIDVDLLQKANSTGRYSSSSKDTLNYVLKFNFPENIFNGAKLSDCKAYIEGNGTSFDYALSSTSYDYKYIYSDKIWISGGISNQKSFSTSYSNNILNGKHNYYVSDYAYVDPVLHANGREVASLSELMTIYPFAFDLYGKIFDIFLGEVDKNDNGYEISETIDIDAILSDVTGWYKQNRNNTIGTILCDVLEKDFETLSTDIDTIFVDNQSASAFLDKIVAYINSYLDEEDQISVETFVDYIQKQLNMSTKEIVSLIRDIFGLDLADPEEGVSLYAYTKNLLTSASLDSIIESITQNNENPSLRFKKASEIGSMIKNTIFDESKPLETVLINIGFKHIVYFLNTYEAETFECKINFKTNSEGLLTYLKFDLDVDFSYTKIYSEWSYIEDDYVDVLYYTNRDLDVSAEIGFNYDDIPASTFVCPNPAPCLKDDFNFTEEEMQKMLVEGFSVGTVGNSAEFGYALKEIVIYDEGHSVHLDAVDNKIVYEGKTLAKYDSATGILTVTPEAFKYNISSLYMKMSYDYNLDGVVDEDDHPYTIDGYWFSYVTSL